MIVRIYTTLALCLLPLLLHAQPYQSIFGKQSTSWVFQWDQSGAVLDTAFIAGDTIVNGIVYKKILLASEAHGARAFGGGLLREDAMSGKVWYKGLYMLYGPGDTLERLAFDFSLQHGDTFDISGATFGASWGIPHEFTLVDSVRTIDGSRHIYFHGSWNWDYGNLPREPFTFIEGIGSNTGILSKLWPTSLLHPYLLCSYKDGVQTSYRNISYAGVCNPAMLAVRQEASSPGLLLSPNPAHDFVHISGRLTSGLHSVEIFSSDGRCIARITSPQSHILSVKSLPAGIYFLKLTGKETSFQRLVVNR